jgi:hypothetical protein
MVNKLRRNQGFKIGDDLCMGHARAWISQRPRHPRLQGLMLPRFLTRQRAQSFADNGTGRRIVPRCHARFDIVGQRAQSDQNRFVRLTCHDAFIKASWHQRNLIATARRTGREGGFGHANRSTHCSRNLDRAAFPGEGRGPARYKKRALWGDCRLFDKGLDPGFRRGTGQVYGAMS